MKNKEQKKKRNNKTIILIIIIIIIILLLLSNCIRANTGGENLDKEFDHIQQIKPDNPEPDEEETPKEDPEVEVIEPEEETTKKPVKDEPVIKEEVILPVIPSNIIVDKEEIILLEGDNFDLYEGVSIDTGRELIISSSIVETTTLTAGTYTVIYTATDLDGRALTNQRKLTILNPISDEDNDGYTNEEEFRSNYNPLDRETTPEYNPEPTLDLSTCKTNITVYSELPDFRNCVVASDNYYNQDNIEVKIDTNMLNNKTAGSYQITVEASDILGNKINKTLNFVINKKAVTIKIDNKNGTYSETLKQLTSNEDDVTLENTDIGVTLTTPATKGSSVGTYPITGTWSNKNYDVTFVNGTYTITKANPTYEIPTGLTAQEGVTLAEVELPEGFTFQGETNTVLTYGTYETLLTYTPSDITNYEIIKNIKAEVVITPIPSNILIAKEKVVLLEGDNYNLSEGVSIDTGRNLEITADINDTTELTPGTHKVTYTATDVDGRKITKQRTVIVLSYLGDEDNDGYTNEEEMKNNKDPMNKDSVPNYVAAPEVNTTTCPTNITVYSTLPSFENCITATDEYYNQEHLTTTIDTSDIDVNNVGTYEVTVKVYDVLQNVKVNKIEFKVNKKAVTIKIDNKNGTYLESLNELTSNEAEVTLENTDIGVRLSTTATKGSSVGTYPITGTWSNKNYEVTFVNGTYTITKAIPSYEIPTGLTAEEDSTLESIALPEGFTYQSDTTTPLAPGTYEILLTYTPKDLTNYEIIRNIKAEVVITPKPYYTITFVDKDNNVLSTQSIKKGESAIEPELEEQEYEANNKDYVFGGWVGNYIEVNGDATIRPFYIEESTSTTYAYILDPKYYMPEDGYGYPTTYYTNALEGTDGSKIPLSIKIGGLTEEQARSIQNKQTTIVALNDKDIMKYLTQSTKDQLNAITYGIDEVGSYKIEWYVLKFQPDGWHLDGYKVYDNLTMNINYLEADNKIRYSRIDINFVNAVDNLIVEIDGEEEYLINVSGNDDIGNQYIIAYTAEDTEKTIKVKYSFKGTEYTKEYTIIEDTITERNS